MTSHVIHAVFRLIRHRHGRLARCGRHARELLTLFIGEHLGRIAYCANKRDTFVAAEPFDLTRFLLDRGDLRLIRARELPELLLRSIDLTLQVALLEQRLLFLLREGLLLLRGERDVLRVIEEKVARTDVIQVRLPGKAG